MACHKLSNGQRSSAKLAIKARVKRSFRLRWIGSALAWSAASPPFPAPAQAGQSCRIALGKIEIRAAAEKGEGFRRSGRNGSSIANAPDEETYSEEETVARRERALKRMLNTPHKPHKPLGVRRKA
jgi:hypothetical protein